MLFTVRKIGTSWGVLIPKGFVDAFSEENSNQIELHFGKMSRKAQKMTERALAIDPPEEYTKLSADKKWLFADDGEEYLAIHEGPAVLNEPRTPEEVLEQVESYDRNPAVCPVKGCSHPNPHTGLHSFEEDWSPEDELQIVPEDVPEEYIVKK